MLPTKDDFAFPQTLPIMQPSTQVPGALEKVGTQYIHGMTLRDYFAGQALVGMLSWCGEGSAEECYEVADAMLAKRSKKEA